LLISDFTLVVLGADTLIGPAIVHALEKKGYVVIASVATPEAVDQVEKKSKGNVKALVLNPKEVTAYSYQIVPSARDSLFASSQRLFHTSYDHCKLLFL
jgi:nucleoside-diphosphate-sugar epimerase